jgi:hypothetical protein
MCMPGHPPSDRPCSSPTKSLSWWSYLIQCHITFAMENPTRKSQSLLYSNKFVWLTFQQHKQDLFQIADACCTIHWIPTASKFFNSEEFSCFEIAQWRRTQVQGLSLAVSRLNVPCLKKYELHVTKKHGTTIFTSTYRCVYIRFKYTTTFKLSSNNPTVKRNNNL